MKYAVLIGVASAALLISGCASRYADAPTPTRWEASRQQKLTAAEHWQRIADHFAGKLNGDLQGKSAGAALYVPVSDSGEFPFVEGFRELLTTALVRQGWDVRTRPGDGVQTVDVRYSVYRFDRRRAANTHYYGEATALATTLWAFAEIGDTFGTSTTSLRGGAVAGVAGLEILDWLVNEGLHAQDAKGPTPQSEIIVTASVTQGDRIVTRYSSLYYVADRDAALYWQSYGNRKGTQLPVRGE